MCEAPTTAMRIGLGILPEGDAGGRSTLRIVPNSRQRKAHGPLDKPNSFGFSRHRVHPWFQLLIQAQLAGLDWSTSWTAAIISFRSNGFSIVLSAPNRLAMPSSDGMPGSPDMAMIPIFG